MNAGSGGARMAAEVRTGMCNSCVCHRAPGARSQCVRSGISSTADTQNRGSANRTNTDSGDSHAPRQMTTASTADTRRGDRAPHSDDFHKRAPSRTRDHTHAIPPRQQRPRRAAPFSSHAPSCPPRAMRVGNISGYTGGARTRAAPCTGGHTKSRGAL